MSLDVFLYVLGRTVSVVGMSLKNFSASYHARYCGTRTTHSPDEALEITK
jgi:hypothetical protein